MFLFIQKGESVTLVGSPKTKKRACPHEREESSVDEKA